MRSILKTQCQNRRKLIYMLNNDQRELSYIEAIREAFDLCLNDDDSVIIIGEGVPDPKAIFNSTKGLQDKFGKNRVFDMPLSENGVTGVCIGAALTGMRPVMIHQRIDFALLSLDQIINNAAKWRFMFNNRSAVPLVIRLIVGRGWGQGPQHSQSLQALFAHIPGLKVVMPVSPSDAKGMMISAIKDDDPVIFIEHRWLHNTKELVPQGLYETPLDKARIVKKGTHATLAAFSYMLVESIIAVNALNNLLGLDVELIDMRSARPLDVNTVKESVQKTGRLVVADTGHMFGGIAGELVSRIVEDEFESLSCAPVRIGSPDVPAATAPSLTKNYYPTPFDIAIALIKQCNLNPTSEELSRLNKEISVDAPHDIPYSNFKGPF